MSTEMFYEFDITEISSGEMRRVPMFARFHPDATPALLTRMCDCQLGAFFTSKNHNSIANFDRGSITNNFASAQYEYLKSHKCSHRPSKKFKAVSVALSGGETVRIAA